MGFHPPIPFERGRLGTLYKQGYSIRTIAQELSGSPSTISREFRHFKEHFYEAEAVHQQYLRCRNQVGRKGKTTHKQICLIEEKLEPHCHQNRLYAVSFLVNCVLKRSLDGSTPGLLA